MSEKPWCFRCGLRHDDPRMDLDGPLFSQRACASAAPTFIECAVVVAFLLIALGVLAACAVRVAPFAPVSS